MASFNSFIFSILEVAAIIPIGIMCLLTFFKDIKANPKLTTLVYAGGFTILSVAGGSLRYCFSLNINFVVLTISALTLLYLFFTVKSNKLKILYLFMSLGSVVSSTRLYGYLLEASLDSSKNFIAIQSWGLLLRWILTAILFVTFLLLIRKIRWLMSCEDLNSIWRFMWFIPLICAAVNMFIIPHDFYFFELGRVTEIYIIVISVLLLMHLLFQLMLYFIAKAVTEKANLDKRAHILSVQASQYESLQRYIENTSKLRHDFKHMARTAVSLAQNGDKDAMVKLLTDYGIKLEANDKQTVFTKNSSLNALICYYFEIANQQNILCDWQVNLPEKLNIENIDLCSVVGNLLENAIHACADEDEKNRYATFKADVEDNGDIYIVTTNGFSGKVKKNNGKYLSTKKDGSGIGIESIKTTVNRYNGFVNFYNDTNTFYADVMMKQNRS